MPVPIAPTLPTGVKFVYATGATIYAFPTTSSLVNWAINRVAFTESGAPDLGLYSGTLPITASEWYFFSGAAQPTSWNDNIGSVDTSIEDENSYADALLKRDMALVVETVGVRSPLQALRILRNKVVRTALSNASGLQIYKEDDATLSWDSATTVPVGTTHPITTSDPN